MASEPNAIKCWNCGHVLIIVTPQPENKIEFKIPQFIKMFYDDAGKAQFICPLCENTTEVPPLRRDPTKVKPPAH